MGLQQAGYQVTGVDIKPQPRYPFRFIQADAMALDWHGYDLIWASPPCQHYSELTPMEYRKNHPSLLPEVATRLRAQMTPYIIENVDSARHLLNNPLFLCGTMFGLNTWRHRWFEIGNVELFFLLPPCNHDGYPIVVSGRGMRKTTTGRRWNGSTTAEKRDAMEIDWMMTDELEQAIPPAYSRFLATAMRAL